MSNRVSCETIGHIWNALVDSKQVTISPQRQRLANVTISEIARRGWASECDIDDYLCYVLPPRAHQMDIREIAALIDVRKVRVSHRPKKPSPGQLALLHDGYLAVDVAQILIMLEQLGLEVDPSSLTSLISLESVSSEYVTGSELGVIDYGVMRHKWPPVLLRAPGDAIPVKKHVARTRAGYKAELWTDADSQPVSLEVRAPKYRRRPPPRRISCEKCGWTYTAGDPESREGHRRWHKRVLHVRQPQPSARMLRRKGDVFLRGVVTNRSPAWMHHEMYERAYAFKRELGYDRIDWFADPKEARPDSEGVLFVSDDATIVGACAFFRKKSVNGWVWQFSWVWVAPDHRRKSVLSRYWQFLKDRYGPFVLAFPVSAEMQAFLRRSGDAGLLNQPVDVENSG